MTKKKTSYLLAPLMTLLITTSVGVALLGANLYSRAHPEEEKSYPEYAYEKSVDKSGSMSFSSQDGSQLYEAEKASLTDGKIRDNSFVSSFQFVELTEISSRLFYKIDADAAEEVELFIRCRAENDYETNYANLFALSVNGSQVRNSEGTIRVSHSENDYQENLLGTIVLQKGNNDIVLTSAVSDALAIDYIALLPKEERSSVMETLSAPRFSFYADDTEQRFEAEQGQVKSGAYLLYGENDSWESHVCFPKEGSFMDYPLSVDDVTSTEFTLRLSSPYEVSLNEALHIKIDDGEISLPEITLTSDYLTVDAGLLPLEEGDHILRFESLTEGLSFDYFTLGSENSFSGKKKVNVYEAEDMSLTDCVAEIQEEAGITDVGYISEGSELACDIVCHKAHDLYGSLLLSVFDTENGTVSLSSLVSIYLNDTELNLSSAVDVSGSYYDFRDGFIDDIPLEAGTNHLVIHCLTNHFNVDNLILFSDGFEDNQLTEAEDLAVTGSFRIENNPSTHGGKNIGYTAEGTKLIYYFYNPEEATCSLSLSYSVWTDDAVTDFYDDILLCLNGETVDTGTVSFENRKSWMNYKEQKIANLILPAGYNVMTLTLGSVVMNFDYLLFH